MRQHRRAHDVEGLAVAAVLGVKMRQHLEPFGFGIVAAPDGGERLQFGDRVLARHVLHRKAQRDLAQAPLRRGAAVAGIGGEAIGGERVVDAAEAFVELAGEHGHRRLEIRRNADGVEFVEHARRAVEVAHRDRRTQRFAQGHALQLERQRAHGAFHVLELLARLDPFAEAGERRRRARSAR